MSRLENHHANYGSIRATLAEASARSRRAGESPWRNGLARRNPPRKVTYFKPVVPSLPLNTVIGSTFEAGRRFRCTMRVDCGQLDPSVVIGPIRGEWQPHMPERLDEEELADCAPAATRSISSPR
jgi:hypothetical protein